MGQREPLIETAGKDANQGVAHLRVRGRVEDMKSLPERLPKFSAIRPTGENRPQIRTVTVRPKIRYQFGP